MAAAILNLDELLAPIPGENPAGEPTPFDIKNDLEEKRKEIDPNSFPANDPARPTEAKLADWPGIIEVAKASLAAKSKDLLVAARLTEALTRVHGFAGLAEGLGLMKAIVEQCWDRCYPDISDGDLEARGGPFNWLSEANRGALFPHAVRGVPMTKSPDGAFGWREWRSIQEGRGGKKEAFDKAVLTTPREESQKTLDELDRCIAVVKGVNETLTAKIGPEAPALSDLRAAISDCHTLAKMMLGTKGPAPEAVVEAKLGAEPAKAEAGKPRAPTRSDIYRRITEAAQELENLEPHSPIPLLLKKAVALGAMAFPQLLKALLDNEAERKKIEKEYGIESEPPAKK